MKQIIQAHSSHKSYTPRHNLQLPTTPTSRPHHRGHHHHPQPQDKQRLHTTCRNHHIVRQRLPTVHKGLGNFPRIFKTTSCLRLRKRLNSQNKCNRWFSNSGSSASIVKVKVQVKVKAAVFFPSSFPWTHVLGVKQFFFFMSTLSRTTSPSTWPLYVWSQMRTRRLQCDTTSRTTPSMSTFREFVGEVTALRLEVLIICALWFPYRWCYFTNMS